MFTFFFQNERKRRAYCKCSNHGIHRVHITSCTPCVYIYPVQKGAVKWAVAEARATLARKTYQQQVKQTSMDEPGPGLNFHEFELDDRLLRVINPFWNHHFILVAIICSFVCPFRQDIARLGWISPTLVQEKAIPFLLEGKDVLIRARTGSML